MNKIERLRVEHDFIKSKMRLSIILSLLFVVACTNASPVDEPAEEVLSSQNVQAIEVDLGQMCLRVRCHHDCVLLGMEPPFDVECISFTMCRCSQNRD